MPRLEGKFHTSTPLNAVSPQLRPPSGELRNLTGHPPTRAPEANVEGGSRESSVRHSARLATNRRGRPLEEEAATHVAQPRADNVLWAATFQPVGATKSIRFKLLSRRHGGAHPEPVGQRSRRGWPEQGVTLGGHPGDWLFVERAEGKRVRLTRRFGNPAALTLLVSGPTPTSSAGRAGPSERLESPSALVGGRTQVGMSVASLGMRIRSSSAIPARSSPGPSTCPASEHGGR
jgi:hypothetical protein